MHRKPSRVRNALRATGTLLIKASQPREGSNSIVRSLFKITFELVGFGMLTKAAFEVSSIAGWAVAALSCFVLSAHLGDSPSENMRGA